MVTEVYLSILHKAGLTVETKPGNVLWLRPKVAITEAVRTFIREHKSEILAELKEEALRPSVEASSAEITDTFELLERVGPLEIPCPVCSRCLRLKPVSRDQCRFSCRCGGEGYIFFDDYLKWKQHKSERIPSARRARQDNPGVSGL